MKLNEEMNKILADHIVINPRVGLCEVKFGLKARILTLLNKKINHAKIRILKRVCHKMKCYQNMFGDCRECRIQKELKRIKETKNDRT